jgi:hypothetical protein
MRIVCILILISLFAANCSGSDSVKSDEEVVFVTAGSSFSPVITVEGTPEILWTWADSTTSSSAAPVKKYGSDAERTNRLSVKPWSAVTRVNIGYDEGDGGSPGIEHVPDQHVTAVQGMRVLATNLRQWCSSYNDIKTLDFSGFVMLDTIECYLSSSLESVNLADTPLLERACFENCSLKALDLSGSPKLRDLRGALNDYSTINFGAIGADIWHICVRDNPQMTNQHLFKDMSQFPKIRELFIWNDNQAGALVIHSSVAGGITVQASGNHFTSADFSGALTDPSGYSFVDLSANALTTVKINGCWQLVQLDVSGNMLNEAAVDDILQTLDELRRERSNVASRINLSIDIGGSGNAAPSADGLVHAANLGAKGWTVTVNMN